MPNSGLFGPFDLTADGVSNQVTGTGPGAYALGTLKNDGLFYIDYIGRSDDDLAARLQDHVPTSYPHFKYAFYPSALAAFNKECQLYHEFKPTANKVHPARPKGTRHPCPVPNCRDLA